MATPFTEHRGDGDATPKFNANSPSTVKELISEYVVELVYVKVTLVLVPATGEASGICARTICSTYNGIHFKPVQVSTAIPVEVKDRNDTNWIE